VAGATLFSSAQLGTALNMAISSWTSMTPEGDGTIGAHKEMLQALVGSCYLFLYQGRELEESFAEYANELIEAPTGSKAKDRLAKAVTGLEKEIIGARQKSKIMGTVVMGAFALTLRRHEIIDDPKYDLMTMYIPDPDDDSWGVEMGGFAKSDPRYLSTCELIGASG
jgi:hypothetical protein